jgi:hypothetical protein
MMLLIFGLLVMVGFVLHAIGSNTKLAWATRVSWILWALAAVGWFFMFAVPSGTLHMG